MEEIIRPDKELRTIPKIDGYAGQRYEVRCHDSIKGDSIVTLGWSEDIEGGSLGFTASLETRYSKVHTVDLWKMPRSLSNGYLLYKHLKTQDEYEITDYGTILLNNGKVSRRSVITTKLPPKLSDVETIQDWMLNPRRVIFERQEFFNTMKAMG